MGADLQMPYLHTLWCDDIRQELGNKTSLMGIYAAEIVLPELPVVLPKLVSHNQLVMAIEDRPKNLTFRLMMDDKMLVEQVSDLDLVAMPRTTTGGQPATRSTLAMVMVLSPIELPAGTRLLQAVAELDGQTVYGTKLWVTVNPQAAAAALGPLPAPAP